jgi:hypothetical protein
MECGGVVEPVAQPGRIRTHRGKTGYVIPADMEIPTCQKCGASWLSTAMIRRLNDEFECQRLTMLHRDSQFSP